MRKHLVFTTLLFGLLYASFEYRIHLLTDRINQLETDDYAMARACSASLNMVIKLDNEIRDLKDASLNR